MSQIIIQKADSSHVPQILGIYAPYITSTCITFEYTVPSCEEFQNRFDKIIKDYPWLVAIDAQTKNVIGYAYSSRAFERAAYSWCADISVYIDMENRGKGIGKLLVQALETELSEMGICNVYAIITSENESSVKFHKKMGYTLAGTLTKSGYKMGRWHDVFFYEKHLNQPHTPPHIPGITPTSHTL